MAEISPYGKAPAFLRRFDNEVLTTSEKNRRHIQAQTREIIDVDVTHSAAQDTPERRQP